MGKIFFIILTVVSPFVCVLQIMSPKNYCYWFANKNPTSVTRRCRHGSLCRFYHLTGAEVAEMHRLSDALRHEDEPSDVECRSCRGRGTIQIIVHGAELLGLTDGSTNLPCIECDGRGSISTYPSRYAMNLIIRRSLRRDWCECRDPVVIYHADHTHPRESKHCYTCRDCKGLVQTG